MSLIGKNTLSLRKKDVKESKAIGLGFKKIQFAHQASDGDSGFNLTALIAPPEMSSLGFTNPSVAELVGANLLFFRKNLTLISSLRGVLVDQLSYSVASSTRINLEGFTAEDGEIFIGTIDASPKTELRAVDAVPIVSTGLLVDGTTDFNVGTPFEINKYPLTQQGAVLVFRNGVQQFRNTGNTSTPDGNYYEVQAGAGLGTIIRFNNAASGSDDSILVVSNGLLAERPDGSMMAVIENLAGQLDNVIPTVAALAGVPETDFQTAPNNVDLKQFGDQVLDHEERINALENPQDVELWLEAGNGYGSTNTKIRRYSNVEKNTLGGYATYSDSATLGAQIVINEPGLYAFYREDRNTVNVLEIGISVNSTLLTTNIWSLTYAQGRRIVGQAQTAIPTAVSGVLRLNAGDVVRPHDGTNAANETAAALSIFQMIRVGD